MADKKKSNACTTTQKGYGENNRTVGLKKDYKVTGKVDNKKASK
ncbi:hypothetical protein [Paenibacillus sp. DMB20]|nr:hypothetical protein [Paenibacillus sp. DMB20]